MHCYVLEERASTDQTTFLFACVVLIAVAATTEREQGR
jgi:hypothetical protein